MVFSSLKFIFLFLPIFICIYYTCPAKWKNIVILTASFIFYSVGVISKPAYILLFGLTVAINYFIALYMGKIDDKKIRKTIFILGLIFDFGWLFIFKYAGFVFSIFRSSFLKLPYINLVLPLGISFYTFQLVSYLVDVYKGKEKPEKSFIDFATYICMFPQLIAGPIVTYGTVRKQLKKRKKCNLNNLASGLKTFIVGLGLKVLIANQLGTMWSSIKAIGFESITSKLAWIGIIGFSLQLYFDFWGYSLMAIGLGRMMNIKLPKNFNHPYMSVSVTEFWRRWHITLGQWFKDYLYIPLGGSRTSKGKWIRNLFFVWVFTGIWHGAGWNFILWGFTLFVLMLIEKLFIIDFLDAHRALGHVYLLFVIPITWAIFAITNMKDLGAFLRRLFPIFSKSSQVIFATDYLKYLNDFKFILIAAVIFATPAPFRLLNKIKDSYIGYIVFVLIFWLSVYCLYRGMNDPFLYFRF